MKQTKGQRAQCVAPYKLIAANEQQCQIWRFSSVWYLWISRLQEVWKAILRECLNLSHERKSCMTATL